MKKVGALLFCMALIIPAASLSAKGIAGEAAFISKHSDVCLYMNVDRIKAFFELHGMYLKDFVNLMNDENDTPLPEMVIYYAIFDKIQEILLFGTTEKLEKGTGALTFIRLSVSPKTIGKFLEGLKKIPIDDDTLYEVDKKKNMYMMLHGNTVVIGFQPDIRAYHDARKSGDRSGNAMIKKIASRFKDQDLYLHVAISKNLKNKMNQSIEKGPGGQMGLRDNVFINALFQVTASDFAASLKKGIAFRQTMDCPTAIHNERLVMVNHAIIVASSFAVTIANSFRKNPNARELQENRERAAMAQKIIGRIKTSKTEKGVALSLRLDEQETGQLVGYMKKQIEKETLARRERKKARTREALFTAIQNGDIGKVEMLLKQNPDLTMRRNGFTPLYIACQGGKPEIVRLLMAKGADVNSKSSAGDYTPLHAASANGNAELVALLIKGGADVNAKAADGNTPLHRAAENGHGDVVRALVSAGSQARALNAEGKSPADMAAKNGHAELSDFIKKQQK